MSHRFIPSSGDATDGLDPSHAAAIKRWAADCLHLGPDDVVTVSELRCGDAGCPLVETVMRRDESAIPSGWVRSLRERSIDS